MGLQQYSAISDSQYWFCKNVWSWGKRVDSYQCFSRPKPRVISLDFFSVLWGKTIFALLADFDSDLFMVESMDLLLPTCILETLGVPGCSWDDSSGVAIFGDGWTTLSDLGCVILGVLLDDDFGDFMVDSVIWRRGNSRECERFLVWRLLVWNDEVIMVWREGVLILIVRGRILRGFNTL